MQTPRQDKLKVETIITCHKNADFDALASMLAAKKLYPQSALIFPGIQEKSLRNFFLQSTSYFFDFKEVKEICLEQVKRLVVVDTRQKDRLPHVQEIFTRPDVQLEAYDHHPDSPNDLKVHKLTYKPWGATTSILVHLLKSKSIAITPDEATILGLGIYEDTGSFKFNSTTEHDFLAAAWLREQGMDVDFIADVLKHEMSADQIYVLNQLIRNSTQYPINGISVTIAEVSLEDYVQDTAFIVAKMMEIESPVVLFILAQMRDRIHVIARSKTNKVNVGEICNLLGGGGHTYAASAVIKDEPLPQVKEKLLTLLYSKINVQNKIKDFMSSPPICIPQDETLKSASSLMTKLGLKAVPVVKSKTKICVGILEHQLAEKAVVHNLGHLLVQDYMQKRFFTLTPTDEITKAIEIILEHKQRLIPIVDGKDIVGVLTRTDLINFLVQDPEAIPKENFGSKRTKNLKSVLKEKLRPDHYQLISLAGQIARELNFKVYLVGGIIRDLLLNFPALDIDLVVEGDGIEFAKKLAQQLNARVKTHAKFKTAVIILPEGEKIDVATARLEYYEHPAALPTVEMSSLKMDLYRRDFTINTLAVDLCPDNFGQLIDFFGGQNDLKQKRIRILHALSFIEDPTRILRAIRFEQRFDFQIGPQTLKLLKNALQLDMLKKISGKRIYQELKLILREKKVINCIFQLQKYNILAAIHPLLTLKPKLEEVLYEANNILHWYNFLYLAEKIETDVFYLLLLTFYLKYLETKEVLQRLDFTPKKIKNFLICKEQVRSLLRTKFLKNSDLFIKLDQLPIEGVLLAMSLVKTDSLKQTISTYVTNYRRIPLAINGNDLLELGLSPGPKVGEILKKIKIAYFEGKAPDKTTQLKLAKELIGKGQS